MEYIPCYRSQPNLDTSERYESTRRLEFEFRRQFLQDAEQSLKILEERLKREDTGWEKWKINCGSRDEVALRWMHPAGSAQALVNVYVAGVLGKSSDASRAKLN